MNNSFSIKRFLKYAGMHFQINSKKYILAVVINALYAIMLYANYDLGYIRESNYTLCLALGYTVMLIIFSATSFNEFHKSKASNRAFTLPASKVEKFLFITLLNIVVLPCLIAVIYGPITSTRTFAYEAQDVNQSLVEAIGVESGAELLDNIADDTTTGMYTQTNYSYKAYAGIIQLCAYFLLCAALFRRRQIFWGMIIFTVSVIILGNVIESMEPYSHEFLDFISDGDILLYISIAFTLLFWSGSWMKFRSLQKCK